MVFPKIPESQVGLCNSFVLYEIGHHKCPMVKMAPGRTKKRTSALLHIHGMI